MTGRVIDDLWILACETDLIHQSFLPPQRSESAVFNSLPTAVNFAIFLLYLLQKQIGVGQNESGFLNTVIVQKTTTMHPYFLTAIIVTPPSTWRRTSCGH